MCTYSNNIRELESSRPLRRGKSIAHDLRGSNPVQKVCLHLHTECCFAEGRMSHGREVLRYLNLLLGAALDPSSQEFVKMRIRPHRLSPSSALTRSHRVLAESLAHPGHNATGIAIFAEANVKLVEFCARLRRALSASPPLRPSLAEAIRALVRFKKPGASSALLSK